MFCLYEWLEYERFKEALMQAAADGSNKKPILLQSDTDVEFVAGDCCYYLEKLN